MFLKDFYKSGYRKESYYWLFLLNNCAFTQTVLNMTIKDEIIAIANQLANKGVTPSVATVKAKLSEPTPLPTIINILKNWQHQPEQTSFDKKEVDNSAESNELSQSLSSALTEALSPLMTELKEIKQLLQSIDSKLEK